MPNRAPLHRFLRDFCVMSAICDALPRPESMRGRQARSRRTSIYAGAMRSLVLAVLLVAGCSSSSSSSDRPAPASPPVAAAPIPRDASVADTPVDVTAEPPKWGAPRPAPEVERHVIELLSKIAAGGPHAADALAPIVVVGPGLWRALQELDAQTKRKELSKLGTPSKAAIPSSSGTSMLEMRSYLSDKDRKRLVANETMAGLAKVFAAGKPRPANAAERELFYALVPFEIAESAITIVEAGGQLKLLVMLDDKGGITWLDAPGEYGQQ